MDYEKRHLETIQKLTNNFLVTGGIMSAHPMPRPKRKRKKRKKPTKKTKK